MHKEELQQTSYLSLKKKLLSAVFFLLSKLSGNDTVWGIGGYAAVVVLAAHENVAVHPPDRGPGVFDDVIVLAVHGAVTHGQHLVVQVIRGVTYGRRTEERCEGLANTFKWDCIEVCHEHFCLEVWAGLIPLVEKMILTSLVPSIVLNTCTVVSCKHAPPFLQP